MGENILMGAVEAVVSNWKVSSANRELEGQPSEIIANGIVHFYNMESKMVELMRNKKMRINVEYF